MSPSTSVQRRACSTWRMAWPARMRPTGRGGRRIAALGAHEQELVEHLVEPVLGARRAQAALDAGDDADRHRRERRAQGDVRRDGRRAGSGVAERGLDLARGLPGGVAVEPGVEAEPRRAPGRAAPPPGGSSASRPDTTRSRSGRRPRARPRSRRPARCRPAPAHRGRRARRRPRSACGSARPPPAGSSAPAGSCRRIRSAPMSDSRRACSSR